MGFTAPHDFSILSHLIGDQDLDYVSAVNSSHTEKGNADVANISLQYKTGFSAHIHVIPGFLRLEVRQIILNGDNKKDGCLCMTIKISKNNDL